MGKEAAAEQDRAREGTVAFREVSHSGQPNAKNPPSDNVVMGAGNLTSQYADLQLAKPVCLWLEL